MKILFYILVYFLILIFEIFPNDFSEKNHIFYLEDKNSEFTVKNLGELRFNDSLEVSGFSNSTWWIKIDIIKTNSIVSIEYPLLDFVTFHYKDKQDGGWKKIETGDHFEFNSRQIRNKNFAFLFGDNIDLPLFVQIKTNGPVFIPIQIYSDLKYIEETNRESYLWGIYFGVIFIFLFYSFISFFSVKDSTYLFYMIHIVGFGMLQAVLNGIAFQFFWPNSPSFANISPNIFHSISLLSALLFSMKFLRLKEYLSHGYKICIGLVLIYILIFLFSFNSNLYKHLLIIQTYLIIASSFFIVSCSLLTIRSGYSPAKVHLIGWVFLFLAIILNRLKTLGYLPHNIISSYGVLFASILEMGLFSIALGFRILKMHQEKESIEKERQKLISDLHDNLGGDLVDIIYNLNKFANKSLIEKSDIETLKNTADKALYNLKTRISSKEESILLEDNFIDAVRLLLISRYQNAKRNVNTSVSENAENFSNNNPLSVNELSDIYLICKEICTNDLKYGYGVSIWNFDFENEYFSIQVLTNTNYTDKNKEGQGTLNLKKRGNKLGATIEVKTSESKFNLIFKMKINSINFRSSKN